jgi:hypothetical protein
MPKTQPILVKQGWNTVSLWSFCSLVNSTVVKTCRDMFSGQNLGQNMSIAPVPLWDWTITSRPAVALDVYDQFGRIYQICHLRHMPWHNIIFQLTATWHASLSLPQRLRITEDYASPCQPHTKKAKGDLQPGSVAPASLSKPFSIFQLKKLKFKYNPRNFKHPLWSKHVLNREFTHIWDHWGCLTWTRDAIHSTLEDGSNSSLLHRRWPRLLAREIGKPSVGLNKYGGFLKWGIPQNHRFQY